MTSTPPLLPPARSTRSQRERDGSPMATAKPEAAGAKSEPATTPATYPVTAGTMVATIDDASLTHHHLAEIRRKTAKNGLNILYAMLPSNNCQNPLACLYLLCL